MKKRSGGSVRRPVEDRLFPDPVEGICMACGCSCTTQFGGDYGGQVVPDGCENCQPEWDKFFRREFGLP